MADRETAAFERGFFLTVPKRRGHSTPCRTTRGSTRVGQEAEGARGQHEPGLLLCFFMGKDWMRQDRQAEQVQDWTV